MKGKIKEFALGIRVDDVGIASVKDYKSPRSPDLQSIFPGAKSLIVLAFKACVLKTASPMALVVLSVSGLNLQKAQPKNRKRWLTPLERMRL